MAAPATTERRPLASNPAAAAHQPYVSDNTQMPEFTWPAVLAGVILGIVGLVQSRKAGAKNGLALAAIIVGAVLLILEVVLFLTVFSFLWSTGMGAAEACMNGAQSVTIAGQDVPCSEITNP